MYCLSEHLPWNHFSFDQEEKLSHTRYGIFTGMCEHECVNNFDLKACLSQWTEMWCNPLEDTLITSYFKWPVPLNLPSFVDWIKVYPAGTVASCQTISSISQPCLFAFKSCDVREHHPSVAIIAFTRSWAIPEWKTLRERNKPLWECVCVWLWESYFTIVLSLVLCRVVMCSLNRVKLSTASYKRLPLSPFGRHLINFW